MHTKNDYERALGGLFEDMPKAVLAAIAVSVLTDGGDRLGEAASLVAKEWQVLHDAGVVPQKPSRTARLLAA